MTLYLLQVLLGIAMLLAGMFFFVAYIMGYFPDATAGAAIFSLAGAVLISEAKK